MQPTVLVASPEKEYELLDSGEGEKLERYGAVILARPDPQALWRKKTPAKWAEAAAIFSRTDNAAEARWNINSSVPERWPVSVAGLSFWVKPTPFKHTGLFPEQSENWKWISKIISQHPSLDKEGGESGEPGGGVKILNLFGYTGGATLAAAKAGAEVVHVDGSRAAITWARDNAELCGLKDAPIRWMLDDVLTFVRREVRRGHTYDGIIMDPPSFGRGPKREVWKIEEHLTELLELSKKLLSPKPLFVLINGYASGYSALSYGNSLSDLMNDKTGMVEIGELTIKELSGGRLLPAGIFARWQHK